MPRSRKRMQSQFMSVLLAVRLTMVVVAGPLAARAPAAPVDSGCPGDGTNSTVVVDYFFNEGSGTNAFNSGSGGVADDAAQRQGVHRVGRRDCAQRRHLAPCRRGL